MSYEQLTWIDPFIYREWPVRLAHRICVKSKDLKSFPLLRMHASTFLSNLFRIYAFRHKRFYIFKSFDVALARQAV